MRPEAPPYSASTGPTSKRKYRALAPFAKFSGDNLEASMKVIRSFREVKNVSELIGLLR